jgi:hypothetical protein
MTSRQEGGCRNLNHTPPALPATSYLPPSLARCDFSEVVHRVPAGPGHGQDRDGSRTVAA